MVTERHIDRVEAQLDGSIYSFESDDTHQQKAVSQRLRQLRRKVEGLQAQIASADLETMRDLRELHEARLLAETSRIEGIDVDMSDTLEAMRAVESRRLIATTTITEAIIAEPKVRASVGLAEAHSIGRDLAASPEHKITLVDIRNLHGLICKGESLAGRFRRGDIRIGSASHVPPPESEMRDHIRGLVEFIETSRTANPVISAAATHTWLAHLHPFEDGNGRVARLLANMCLARRDWPPVIIRSGPTKQHYYEALAQSDEAGELLPVVSLFTEEVGRTAREWESPQTAIDALEAELNSATDEFKAWQAAVDQIEVLLRRALDEHGLSVERVGEIGKTDYEFLKSRNAAGNGWFLRVLSRGTRTERLVNDLVWVGFRSNPAVEHVPKHRITPSLFVSERNFGDDFEHPYRPLSDNGVIDELLVLPGIRSRVGIRAGNGFRIMRLPEAMEVFGRFFIARAFPKRRTELHESISRAISDGV